MGYLDCFDLLRMVGTGFALRRPLSSKLSLGTFRGAGFTLGFASTSTLPNALGSGFIGLTALSCISPFNVSYCGT
jgi:hypothetical protein